MQVQSGAIIVALMCCLLLGISSAGSCGVSAPEMSLIELHSACTSDSLSRDRACVAAIHRFCQRVAYPTAMSTLGVSREVTDGRIGISCIKSLVWQNVPFNTLQSFHGGCDLSKTQDRACLAAIHRFCINTLDGYQYAGIAQEVPSTTCLLYTSPSPRDATLSRMPSSA